MRWSTGMKPSARRVQTKTFWLAGEPGAIWADSSYGLYLNQAPGWDGKGAIDVQMDRVRQPALADSATRPPAGAKCLLLPRS